MCMIATLVHLKLCCCLESFFKSIFTGQLHCKHKAFYGESKATSKNRKPSLWNRKAFWGGKLLMNSWYVCKFLSFTGVLLKSCRASFMSCTAPFAVEIYTSIQSVVWVIIIWSKVSYIGIVVLNISKGEWLSQGDRISTAVIATWKCLQVSCSFLQKLQVVVLVWRRNMCTKQ